MKSIVDIAARRRKDVKTIVVIPGLLKVLVFVHVIETEDEKAPIQTLAFLSSGLLRTNQKEIFIAIQDEQQCLTISNIPMDPINFIRTIFSQFVTRGHAVDSGDVSLLGGTGVMGWNRVAFVPTPRSLDDLLPTPTLNAILISAQEQQAWRSVGSARVLSMLGQNFGHHPFPYWSNVHRGELQLAQMMKQTCLNRINTLHWKSSHLMLHRNKTVYFLPSTGTYPNLSRTTITANKSIAILPSLSLCADACLTLSGDACRLSASSPNLSDGCDNGAFTTNGCCLVVTKVDVQEECSCKLFEDGFRLSLTGLHWGTFWNAFARGESFIMDSSSVDFSFSFEMKWISSGAVATFLNSQDADKGPIHVAGVTLLYGAKQDNVDASELAKLIQRIEGCVVGTFKDHPEDSGQLRFIMTVFPDKEFSMEVRAFHFADESNGLVAEVCDSIRKEMVDFRSRREPMSFVLDAAVRV